MEKAPKNPLKCRKSLWKAAKTMENPLKILFFGQSSQGASSRDCLFRGASQGRGPREILPGRAFFQKKGKKTWISPSEASPWGILPGRHLPGTAGLVFFP